MVYKLFGNTAKLIYDKQSKFMCLTETNFDMSLEKEKYSLKDYVGKIITKQR